MRNRNNIDKKDEKMFIMVPKSEWEEQIQRLMRIEQMLLDMEENKSRNEWLTSRDAARLMGVSLRTLQNYRNQGDIPYSQVHGTIRYKRADIEKVLNEQNY